MAYIDDNLISGETILYRTRLHWMVMTPAVIGALIVGLPGLGLVISALLNIKEPGSGQLALIGIVVLAIAVFIFLMAGWQRSSVEMAVTNKRVLAKRGLVRRTTIEMMLGKIESIAVDQGVMGRLFEYGTIIVRGTGGTPEPFPKIAHPLEFRRQVQEQLDKIQNHAAAASAS